MQKKTIEVKSLGLSRFFKKNPTFTNDNQYLNEGILHREDGPAVISPKGDFEWWQHGKRFREKKLPTFESHSKKTIDKIIMSTWHDENNQIHRIGYPAFIRMLESSENDSEEIKTANYIHGVRYKPNLWTDFKKLLEISDEEYITYIDETPENYVISMLETLLVLDDYK